MCEFQAELIERHVNLLGLCPGEIEIRAVTNTGLVLAGRYDDIGALVRECAKLSGAANLYVGLQPRSDSRCPVDNRILPRRATTRDEDICAVTNVVLDIDAVRPHGLPASDAELAAVRTHVEGLRDYLHRCNLPRPIEITTGNGVHLLLPVKLVLLSTPEDRARVSGIVRGFEVHLRNAWPCAAARMDSIHNFSRVGRLAGTLNIKDAPGPDRPWRLCGIEWAPQVRTEATLEQLAAIVGDVAPGSKKSDAVSTTPCLAWRETHSRSCCSAIFRLSKEGYADRSKAIWAMCMYLAFLGESSASAVSFLTAYDATVTHKLPNERRARKYMEYWYGRALIGPAVPCRWLRGIGYCPGVAQCDWGKVAAEVPDDHGAIRAILECGNQEEENRTMWKPKDMAKCLEVKPGDYSARVVDAVEAVSKSSNAEMTTVIFETTGDNPFRVYDHFVRSHPVAERRMLALLVAVGLADREQVDEKELIGKLLVIRVAVERVAGMPQQPRIKKFMPAGEQTVPEVPAAQ